MSTVRAVANYYVMVTRNTKNIERAYFVVQALNTDHAQDIAERMVDDDDGTIKWVYVGWDDTGEYDYDIKLHPKDA
jgi:hypothetical protein